jgi:hypothetical protein
LIAVSRGSTHYNEHTLTLSGEQYVWTGYDRIAGDPGHCAADLWPKTVAEDEKPDNAEAKIIEGEAQKAESTQSQRQDTKV